MAIKAVLFDLDNTLYDFSTVHRQALAALAEYGESRFDVPARRFLIAYQEADKQLKRELPHVAACHNRIIICQRMLEAARSPLYRHAAGAVRNVLGNAASHHEAQRRCD